MRAAFGQLAPRARAGLELACRHFGAVARRELAALKEFDLKPTPGLTVFERLVPVESAGVLVGSGRVSTLLAGAIGAAVAGVARRVVAVEPEESGAVAPHLLAAAYMTDVTELLPVGSVEGLAAMALGTGSVAAVTCLVGQGGAEVAAAVDELRGGACRLLVAGPGELLVLADHTAAPEFVAADLLDQATADPDGSCALVTTSELLAEAVRERLRLWRRGRGSCPAAAALRRAQAVVVRSLSAAVALANARAPQRLSLLVKRPDELVGRLRGYGTLLVGPHTPAALATRVTGAGVLLPGGAPALGAAPGRAASPLSVSTYLRRVTVQQVDPSAYLRLGRAAATLAELDGLEEASEAISERIRPSGTER